MLTLRLRESAGHMTNVGFQYSLRAEGAQADESLHCGSLSDAHETDGVLLLDQNEAMGSATASRAVCRGVPLFMRSGLTRSSHV